MRKISVNALTEKGVLKAKVRDGIVEKDLNSVADLLGGDGWELVADKNAIVLTREDADGNKVYTTLTMTVGLKHPTEKAERKSKPKAKPETEAVEIE